MHQIELIEMLKRIRTEKDSTIKLKILLKFIEQVLTEGNNIYIKRELEDEFSDFAYELDNFEPDEKFRNEDISFFGVEELDKRIDGFLKKVI